MGTALYGELTADGTQVVLVAAADDRETDRMATALRQLTPLMQKSRPPGALLCPATWTAVTQLAHTFTGNSLGSWIPGPRLQNWIIAEFTRRTATRHQLASEIVPEGLTARDYQLEAAAMIAATGKVMVCDEPGLGKSCETILGLKARSLTQDIFPLLIIVPSWDVGDVWTREIARWAPDWKEPAAWGGPVRWTYNPGHADTYLTTYATARRDAADASGPLMRFARWSAIVLDEHHALKNDSTKQSSAARRLTAHAGTVVALSGTPVTRDTGDIYPVLAAMDPVSWPSKERFRKRYCLLADGDYEERIEGLNPLTEREFRTALLGQLRRVAKADVLDQLPPKVYSVRRVEIPPEWRAAYDTMEQDMLAQLPPGDDGAAGELPVMSTLAQLTRLSQLASSACDVAVTEEPDENGVLRKHYQVTLKQPCWTADALLGILAERPGHPVAVFAPSRQLIMLAGTACEKAGYRCGYITGQHTRKGRAAAIESFQAGQLDVILVTTGAGGQGITLTAADTVVFLKRPWPLEESIQAEDRCMAAGTPVLTAAGWIPVEKVKPGDLVVTHTGESQPVTDTWSRVTTGTYRVTMAEVSITGQQPVTCTADHQFMLRDGTWCEAAALRPGDWLAMPGNDITEELSSLPFDGVRTSDTFINCWGTVQRNGRVKHAPADIEITDDFLFVLGYFAGDGFASPRDTGAFISFSGNDYSKKDALDRCERWALSQGLSGKRHHQTVKKGTEQRFFCREWARWFHREFGGMPGAVHKRLPGFTLRLNERQSRIVLSGLTASDGYQRAPGKRIEYCTVSPVLTANVLQLAIRAGHRPSLTEGSTGQFLISYGGQTGPHTAGRVRSVLLRHPRHLPGDIRERVYDISVKEAESFTAGGVVVHNCHRLGAEIHDSIEIIDIVTRDTVDERIRAALREKSSQLADFVQDPRIVRELLGGLR